MKRQLTFFFVLFIVVCINAQSISFNDFFIDKTMRFDFFHTGTKTSEIISFDKIKMEPFWAGSKINLVDKTNLGKYLLKIFDVQTNQLIYSRGFCSVFGEWQTTDEALKKKTRTFHESVLFPYPRKKVKLEIHTRDRENYFKPVYYRVIDPVWVNIRKELKYSHFEVKNIINSGEPSKKVDLLILAEGFTRDELPKFRKNAKEKVDFLLSMEPFKSNRYKFNVCTIEVISEESGISDPGEKIFKSSFFDCSFNAFELDRYVLTYANEKMRDVAANAPYDYICIIANSPKYGGGGIFKLYSISTLDERWRFFLFTHEFGHNFVGLGDEYYSSAVAYNEFYPTDVEPWKVHLTALHDKNSVKWKELIPEGPPIPTPAEEQYKNTVGVYEGGGYAAKGIYRPFIDCIMKNRALIPFCPVCQKGIKMIIDLYSN